MIKEKNEFGELDMNEYYKFIDENQIQLPEDYYTFLKSFNGGRPVNSYLPIIDTNIDAFFGIHNGPAYASLLSNIDVYSSRIPSWYIPIASDVFGNLIIMSLYEENFGVVAFWDHEKELTLSGHQCFDNLTYVADTFTDFISLLRKE